jgi:hypothetical protein
MGEHAADILRHTAELRICAIQKTLAGETT